MIHAFGDPDPPVKRLVSALAERGHEVRAAGGERPTESATLILGPGVDVDPLALGVLLGAWRTAPGARVLVVSFVGVHPDARAQRLRALWETEERARGSGLPVLVVRLAPLVGPLSPLWLKLRSRPRLPKGGRMLLHPVAEADVVEALDRALVGRAPWEGWHEFAGPEVLSLAELAAEARAAGAALPGRTGAWEPSLDELGEQRLCEAGRWADHFGVSPASVRGRARAWNA